MISIWHLVTAWYIGIAKKKASAPPPNTATPNTATPNTATLNAATPNTATTAPRPATPATVSDKISDHVIGCASTVSSVLGSGLPEIIYENALAHELRKAGLAVTQQQAVAVYYDGMIVGDYTADLLVENAVMVELKPVTVSVAVYAAECRNYLKATGLTLCLTFNFATPRLGIKRVTNTL